AAQRECRAGGDPHRRRPGAPRLPCADRTRAADDQLPTPIRGPEARIRRVRRDRALQQCRRPDHPAQGNAGPASRIRAHPAPVAQPLLPDGARLHHHGHAGDDLGGVSLVGQHHAAPCARPDRRAAMGRDNHAALREASDGDFRMSAELLGWSIFISQIFLGLAMVLAAVRVLWGPRAQDRVLALDTVYVIAATLLLTFGIRTGGTLYFEAALVIALLGFVGTAALAKF